jgi:hypothetical protein
MAEAEQLDEISVDVDDQNQDPAQGSEEGSDGNEAAQEFDIVLAGQDEAQIEPEQKSTSDHILSRVMRKKDKLTEENEALKQQLLAKASQPAAVVKTQPDEDDFDDRKDYLQAHSEWQRQMLHDVTAEQLQQQQHGHRAAAQQQSQDAALATYSKNASNLKVGDFNDTQDKAFDVLGDEFARMLAMELPEDAPKLMYWFGKNPKDAEEYRDKFMANPSKTTFALGKLAGKLTIQPRQTNAAQPESKIESGSVGGINEDWQALLDKTDDAADMSNIAKTLNERRAIKKRAKAAGFDVSTLK